MKATLEFQLPEDEDAFRVAVHARDVAVAASEAAAAMRLVSKHHTVSEEVQRILDDARGSILQTLEQAGWQ